MGSDVVNGETIHYPDVDVVLPDGTVIHGNAAVVVEILATPPSVEHPDGRIRRRTIRVTPIQERRG
jgi:hypothetical protein